MGTVNETQMQVPCILSCIVQFCEEIWNCIFLIFLFSIYFPYPIFSIPFQQDVREILLGQLHFMSFLKLRNALELLSWLLTLLPFSLLLLSFFLYIIPWIEAGLKRMCGVEWESWVWRRKYKLGLVIVGEILLKWFFFWSFVFKQWYCVSLHVTSSSLSYSTWKWMMVKWIKLVVERVRM